LDSSSLYVNLNAVNRRQFFLASAALAAQPPRRPNLLFVIADDWSHGHAGAYGANWVKTPHFDRVAREGVLFHNAFTSNPKCSPCRATILTGRNSWQLKEAINHYSVFPNEFAIYPVVLEQAGYFVGMTGKGWGPGEFKATGFKHNPAGKEYQKLTNQPPTSGISNRDYAGNFADFLMQRAAGQPFCFWLGGQEPHRVYEDGSGLRAGKSLQEVKVPAYFPDNRTVRSDMLDYALEVEWFDQHLGKALAKLEEIGELDNTLVVVTSDHGMPFPRIKGQIYEQGFHLPLAIRWGKLTTGGRNVNDFINTRDFAPTFLEAAGVKAPPTMTGKSFVDVLKSPKSGTVDSSRDVMLIAKERHDLGRPNDGGYPVRAIRTPEYLYVRNFEPTRWPAGNPETGYRNVDDSPTKTLMISSFDKNYQLAFGFRASEELYKITEDPECMKNLAAQAEFAGMKRTLRDRMETMLKEQGDPRYNGNAAFFDSIEYYGPKKHAYDNWLKNQRPEK